MNRKLQALITMALTASLLGCGTTTQTVKPIQAIEIERLKQNCIKCEEYMPNQCAVGNIGMCNDIFNLGVKNDY